MSVDEAVEELCKYAELDGTEWGETVIAMRDLWRYRSYISI